LDDKQIVTVDVVLLTVIAGRLHVGLLQRSQPPFAGQLALVGGYVHASEDDSAEHTAHRVLKEKTGLQGMFIEQLATFSGPHRDPRGWSLSVAYFALVPYARLESTLGPEPRLRFTPAESACAGLPFDHSEIVRAALDRLRGKGAYSTLPARLLPDAFTLSDLQQTYEIALGVPRIDKSSFRRKLNELDLLEPVDGERAETGGRQAQLYRLKGGRLTFDRRI
jgi:ADP-ribose pyrophosphatase YjhB (NUDIX family)